MLSAFPSFKIADATENLIQPLMRNTHVNLPRHLAEPIDDLLIPDRIKPAWGQHPPLSALPQAHGMRVV